MGFPTKVQLIKRQASEQWYINFPSAVAQALEFQKGESVEWIIEDKSLLALRRHAPPAPALKKTLPPSITFSTSGKAASRPSKIASPPAPKPSRCLRCCAWSGSPPRDCSRPLRRSFRIALRS